MSDAQMQKPVDSKPAAPVKEEKSAFVPLEAIEGQAAAPGLKVAGASSKPVVGTYAFKKRAEMEEKRHEGLVIVRFEGLAGLNDPSSTKRITVQRQSRAWLLPGGSLEPTPLGAGIYQLGNLKIYGQEQEKDNGKGKQVYNYGVICRASVLPISATFVLPDTQAFEEREGDLEQQEYNALCEPQLRTSDGLLGAARCQISFVCDNAQKLIQAFGQEKVSKGEVLDQAAPRTVTRQSIAQRIMNWLSGAEAPTPDFFTNIKPFTVADLYKIIRLELMGALRTSVGKYNAATCYNMGDNRPDFEHQITDYLKDTLESYGINIERVSAFQFICPAYEAYLSENASAELNRQKVGVTQKETETKDMFRNIAVADAKKQVSAVNDVSRHTIEQEELTQVEKDNAALELQRRRLERDKEQKNHGREQQKADELQKIDLLREKGRMAMELQKNVMELENLRLDSQQQREIALLTEYAKLPGDQALQLAMIHHPHLVDAFEKAHQARGLDEQIKMLNDFRGQLTAAVGKGSDQTNKMMLAVVQQVGGVLQARLGGQSQPESRRAPVEIIDPQPTAQTDTP